MLPQLLLATCLAGDPARGGTQSRQARQQAVNAIPFDQLTAESRQKLTTVIDNPSMYRRLPVTSTQVDPDLYLFLVRYPEVLVDIWQIMGVTQMSCQRTGPFELKTDDGAGAISDVELIYGTSTKNIYYAEGSYSGPLLRRQLKGRCVMLLQTRYEQGAGGEPTATSWLDVFVKVENATASMIAKTLNPLIGPTADHNFVETMNFVQRLNETTEQNGVGVQSMAYRLPSIDASVREKFIQVAGIVYERQVRSEGVADKTASELPLAPKSNAFRPANYVVNEQSGGPKVHSRGDGPPGPWWTPQSLGRPSYTANPGR